MASDPDDTGDPQGGRQAAHDLRDAVGGYVRAVHGAYLDAGGGSEGAGLASGPFTVVAAAGRSLHLLATRDEIDVPERGTAEPSELDGLTWTLVFLDPSVLPELADVPTGPDEPRAVLDVLGVDRALYHLVVGQGSALTSHHAMHAGTGLAHREQRGPAEDGRS